MLDLAQFWRGTAGDAINYDKKKFKMYHGHLFEPLPGF
jgi:hypothetical protein